jgi:hypothetical protein
MERIAVVALAMDLRPWPKIPMALAQKERGEAQSSLPL